MYRCIEGSWYFLHLHVQTVLELHLHIFHLNEYYETNNNIFNILYYYVM